MPNRKQRVAQVVLVGLVGCWLQLGAIRPGRCASDPGEANQRGTSRGILLYYGNRRVDLRKAAAEPKTADNGSRLEVAAPPELPASGDRSHEPPAADPLLESDPARDSSREPSFHKPSFHKPSFRDTRSSHETASDTTPPARINALRENVLRESDGRSEGHRDTAVGSVTADQLGVGLTTRGVLEGARITNGELAGGRAEVATHPRPTAAQGSTQSPEPAQAASSAAWFEQPMMFLVSALLGAVVCLILVVIQLLITTRHGTGEASPTVRVEMPAGGMAFPAASSDRGCTEGADGASRQPRRAGAVADLAEQPLPNDLLAGSYQQQRQQEQEQKEQREAAILTEIYHDNLRMRQCMQTQLA